MRDSLEMATHKSTVTKEDIKIMPSKLKMYPGLAGKVLTS